MCLFSTSAFYRQLGYYSIGFSFFALIEAVGCPFRKNCRAEGGFWLLIIIAIGQWIIAYLAFHLAYGFEKAMRITWGDL